MLRFVKALGSLAAEFQWVVGLWAVLLANLNICEHFGEGDEG